MFEPGDPPRTGRMFFRGRDRGETVPTPVVDVLPVLLRARHGVRQGPVAFWGEVAALALRLVARGRILPGVSADGFDAWRAGPLEPADVDRIHELAAAMPADARAASTPGPVTDPYRLVRVFLDAVADAMPRTAAAVPLAGHAAFAAVEPQPVPELRPWADEISARRAPSGEGGDVDVSLRIEPSDGDIERAAFRAVVQVHAAGRVRDARAMWHVADDSVDAVNARVRLDTALALRRASRQWAPLERLLQHAVPDELDLTDAGLEDLLAGAAARLAAVGVDVYWPQEMARDLTATALIGHSATPVGAHAEVGAGRLGAPHDQRRGMGGERQLSLDWQLALGGEPLSEAEMDRLAEAHRPVVRLRDRWVLVDPDLVRKARTREMRPLPATAALGATLTGTVEVGGERVEVTATGWLHELRERVTRPDDDPVPQPAALVGTLRDYQLRGLRWLAHMTSLGLGCCLADDMGLGKTITLIALHLHRQADTATAGPTLVVCPASLLGNWDREIERFAPGTPVRRFHGTGRLLDQVVQEATDGFVLTTYATMRRDADALGAHRWGMAVADEAQHVKNPLSATAKALRQLPAGGRVALTGTPVENNLSELWAILDWTTPGLLGTLHAFRTRWVQPIESGRSHGDEAARLSRLVRPFLLRRGKTEPGIAPELPAKTEIDRLAGLTHEQAGLYEAAVREAMAQIRASSGTARRGLMVKLLTELKQICNHPAQYLKEPGGELAGRSGKLELLDELVDTILAEGGAVLVFTQYVAMARLIERHLAARDVPVQLLHGGTPVPRREEMVRRFQQGADGASGARWGGIDSAPVFLLSLKAAGTGLNLTRADHVIHYDRWWNPSVEEQATDRAYRIGQTRPVQVHRLIAEGTLEDRIAAMLQAKRELADAVLRENADEPVEAALTELSDAELADLVGLRGHWGGMT